MVYLQWMIDYHRSRCDIRNRGTISFTLQRVFLNRWQPARLYIPIPVKEVKPFFKCFNLHQILQKLFSPALRLLSWCPHAWNWWLTSTVVLHYTSIFILVLYTISCGRPLFIGYHALLHHFIGIHTHHQFSKCWCHWTVLNKTQFGLYNCTWYWHLEGAKDFLWYHKDWKMGTWCPSTISLNCVWSSPVLCSTVSPPLLWKRSSTCIYGRKSLWMPMEQNEVSLNGRRFENLFINSVLIWMVVNGHSWWFEEK